MTKQGFESALRGGLAGFAEDDITKAIDFYVEMINDRMEDGASEEEAVAALGPVDGIIDNFIAETPMQKIIKKRVKREGGMRAWEIVLLVLGSPIWLPILICILAVVLTIYIVLWALVIVLYAVTLALAASSLACLAYSVFNFCEGNFVPGLFALTCALLLAGLAILLFLASNRIARLIAILGKKIWLGIKYLVLGKKRERRQNS